jgi:arylsulfatase A-like enzyme
MDGRLELESAAPATLRLHTENASSRPAAFRLVGPDGAEAVSELTPGSAGALDLPLPAGTSSVRMVIEGDPDGLFLWGAPQLARAGDDRPSVILVTLDTTRRDALSPWGGRTDVSPRLGQLARSATVYDHAWATSPWTLPSHASMLTGMYPTRHGAGVSDDWMVPSLESLAELLAGEGWFTAGFAGGEMCASRWGMAQGFDVYHDPDGFETRGDALTDAALEIVERHGDAPLFLFVNYFDPHALYRAPEPFASRFGVPELARAIADTPVWGDFAGGSGKAWGSIIEGEAPAGPAELEWLEAAYLAEVAFMDHQLGRLLDGLDARRLLDDALVVVVADHGEFLGEDGFFSHACRLDPELTWVPMLVRWPGQTRGDRSAQLVSHVDVFGTALEAAGLPVRSHDGLPLGPEGHDALTARSRVFMEEHESRIHPLFAHMKIAPSVYGIQELAHREVIWQGGMDCGRLSGDRWSTDRCGASWQDRLTELADVARALERRDEAEVGVLSEAEREALEALGYVR